MPDSLDAECAVLCRYLIGTDPSQKITALYRRAHELGVVATRESDGRFQRALVAVARMGSLPARMSDSHARLFAPAGLLRRKLSLLLSLVESDSATFERVDRVDSHSPISFALRLSGLSALFALILLVGLPLFLPLRVACALLGPQTQGSGA